LAPGLIARQGRREECDLGIKGKKTKNIVGRKQPDVILPMLVFFCKIHFLSTYLLFQFTLLINVKSCVLDGGRGEFDGFSR
jgi:hypothetical protein